MEKSDNMQKQMGNIRREREIPRKNQKETLHRAERIFRAGEILCMIL